MNRRSLKSRWGGWIIFFLILYIIWQSASVLINNSIICPSPGEVLEQMILQIQMPAFYSAFAATLWRTIAGLCLSFCLALFLSLVAVFFKAAASFLNRLAVIAQAIPNIAYVILLLFWTSRQTSVLLVIFFLLCPMMYRQFYEQLRSIREKWHDVFAIYPQPWQVVTQKVFLPMLEPVFASALKSGVSMAVKAAVMAEIIVSIPEGLGRLMQSARMNINVAGVMAYVIWLVLMAAAAELLVGLLLKMSFGSKKPFFH